jgi:UDP-glucose 4-epimerase
VSDVVQANLRSLTYSGSGVFNIGTGTETTVGELYDTLNRITDAKLERTYGPAKLGEQQRSVLSYERARQVLGWTPQVSLEDGLSQTVAWFQKRPSSQVPASR